MSNKKQEKEESLAKNLMLIQSVRFYRTELSKSKGESEKGIIINNGESIIDSRGKLVTGIWDYTIVPFVLTIHLDLDLF